MKTYTKFTALILSLGCTIPTLATSLNDYRAQFNIDANTRESMKLSLEILKVMGMDDADMSAIPVPGGVKGNSRHSNSSLFIKRRMNKGIRALVEQERHGRQFVFQPSSTMDMEEAAEAKRQYLLGICHKVYPDAVRNKDGKLERKEGTLDAIVDEIRDLALAKKNGPEAVVIFPAMSIRRPLTGSDNFDGTIETKLGQFNGMEIEEGSIVALQFTQMNREKISVSLSMLATFLSEEDDAFIAMMDCVYDQAHQKVTTADELIKRYSELKGPIDSMRNRFSSERSNELEKIDIGLQRYNKEYYGPIDTFMGTRLQTARRANALLKTLDAKHLSILLNVMMRAQRSEIPSGAEIPELSKIIGAKINFALNKGDQATVTQTVIDANYFSDIQKQLSRLKDVLEENEALRIQTQNIIRDEIRGVRK